MNEPVRDPPDEEAVFAAALALPAGERAAYLVRACGIDAALRARVEALLQAHDEAGTLLEAAPGGAVRAALTTPPSGEAPGTLIGRYKLLQKIGEGGCGVVYMAEQEEPVRRRVALKVIKLGMDTREVVARFEAERQALALMDHPNIARVLDGGATATGRPYFVMELVRGVPITKYCDEHNLPTPARLGLFMQVCHAVQHAHQKGIIHRDLKPSNILVTVNDGSPVPKVIDFGIAKATQGRLTDRTLFTAFEQFIGTPAYMSPEQAELTSVDVDTRADIYSLGVLLYELLTGRTPFDSKSLLQAGLDDIRRVIREVEPPRPSARVSTLTADDRATVAKLRATAPLQLSTLLRGDLDWIVMRCLEKDRRRRYETANGLALDIGRHLSNEPVVARPPSTTYGLQKLIRRNRLAFAATAAVAAALLLGLGVSTWQYFKEKAARERAVAAERLQIILRDQAETALQRAVAAEMEQSRLRQQAEEARNNEARQRSLAEEARNRESEQRVLAEESRNGETRQRVQAESDRKKAESEAGKSRQVAQFLQDMLRGVGPSVALGRDTKLLREILDKTVERLGKDLKDQPEVEAELRTIIGEVYRELGEYEKAEAMQREALMQRRKLFGNEHFRVATSLNALGLVLEDRGDFAGAETMQREALPMIRKTFGNEHPAVAASLNNLANILHKRGDLAGAETTRREALAIQRKLLGSEHPAVATSLNNLADSLSTRGDLAGAETMQREALAIQRKLLGHEHPDVAGSLANLANMLLKSGANAEAEAMQREALAMRRKLLGHEHPAVANSLILLGTSFYMRGDFAAAEAMQREALAIQRKLHGNEHPEVAVSLLGLAVTLLPSDLAGAEVAAREALTMHRKLLGAAHPGEISSSMILTAILIKRGKNLPDAEELLVQAWLLDEIHPSEAGPKLVDLFSLLYAAWAKTDSTKRAAAAQWATRVTNLKQLKTPQAIWAMVQQFHNDESASLAALLDRLGRQAIGQFRSAEAEVYFRKEVDILQRSHQDGKLPISRALGGLGWACYNQGLYSDALVVFQARLRINRQVDARNRAEIAVSLFCCGATLVAVGDLDGAEPMLRESLEMTRTARRTDEELAANCLHHLGRIAAARGELDRAESLLKEALAIQRRVFGNQHRLVLESLQILAGVMGRRGDHHQVKELFAEAGKIIVAGKYLERPFWRGGIEIMIGFYSDWTKADPAKVDQVKAWTQKLDELDRSVAAERAKAPAATPDRTKYANFKTTDGSTYANVHAADSAVLREYSPNPLEFYLKGDPQVTIIRVDDQKVGPIFSINQSRNIYLLPGKRKVQVGINAINGTTAKESVELEFQTGKSYHLAANISGNVFTLTLWDESLGREKRMLVTTTPVSGVPNSSLSYRVNLRK